MCMFLITYISAHFLYLGVEFQPSHTPSLTFKMYVKSALTQYRILR